MLQLCLRLRNWIKKKKASLTYCLIQYQQGKWLTTRIRFTAEHDINEIRRTSEVELLERNIVNPNKNWMALDIDNSLLFADCQQQKWMVDLQLPQPGRALQLPLLNTDDSFFLLLSRSTLSWLASFRITWLCNLNQVSVLLTFCVSEISFVFETGWKRKVLTVPRAASFIRSWNYQPKPHAEATFEQLE